MIRITSLVIVLLMVGAAIGLYRFKEQAADRAAEIQSLRIQIAEERERISLLEAEWTYLNQPDRIQELSKRHLDLQRMQAGQIGTVDALPMRPIELDPFAGDALGALSGEARADR
jgi:hypothetical protein